MNNPTPKTPSEMLQEYCDNTTRCLNHHHRPLADIDKPCPVCGKIVPFKVTECSAQP